MDSRVPQQKAAWRIEASSPGVWGNELAVQLRTTHRAQTRTVVQSGVSDQGSSGVVSVINFERGTLVRLFKAGCTPPNLFRVVAWVAGGNQQPIRTGPLPHPHFTH